MIDDFYDHDDRDDADEWESNPFKRRSFDINRINPMVISICQRLKNAGFDAWIVGGGIRDLIIGKRPKDFDVVTVAKPREIKEIFGRQCLIIGKRFQIVHVMLKGRQFIEVSTLRAATSDRLQINSKGRIEKDNQFGQSVKEDAKRRDFSINGIYFDPIEDVCIDFVNGLEHIKKRQLICIGDPVKRFREDPIRITRAIRFEAKLGFTLGQKEKSAITELKHLLLDIPAARLLDESIKLFHTGHALESFAKLQAFDLMPYFLPLNEHFQSQQQRQFVTAALTNTDYRVKTKQGVSPPFIFAVFLWPALQARLSEAKDHSNAYWQKAVRHIFSQQARSVPLPKLWLDKIQSVWQLQYDLEVAHESNQAEQIANLAEFRAAYDFLLLRHQSGDSSLLQWTRHWQPYYQHQAKLKKSSKRPLSKRLRYAPKNEKHLTRRHPSKKRKIFQALNF